jgi:hypothetical protein
MVSVAPGRLPTTRAQTENIPMSLVTLAADEPLRAAQCMSTDMQKYSVENQAAIASYAARRNLDIVRTYVDRAKWPSHSKSRRQVPSVAPQASTKMISTMVVTAAQFWRHRAWRTDPFIHRHGALRLFGLAHQQLFGLGIGASFRLLSRQLGHRKQAIVKRTLRSFAVAVCCHGQSDELLGLTNPETASLFQPAQMSWHSAVML